VFVEEEVPRRASAPKRVAFATLLTIVGLNVWTGGPLLALWVGSRVQGSGPPTMGAVFVVVVVLAAVCLALGVAFGRLNQAYLEMTGQAPTVRQHTPWLRSMRGERPVDHGVAPTLTTPERILVGMVVVAVVLFEIWFFFFSASPIDNRTGRSALDPQSPPARVS
jgi:prolipoprotein diacylglyceryltransferase